MLCRKFNLFPSKYVHFRVTDHYSKSLRKNRKVNFTMDCRLNSLCLERFSQLSCLIFVHETQFDERLLVVEQNSNICRGVSTWCSFDNFSTLYRGTHRSQPKKIWMLVMIIPVRWFRVRNAGLTRNWLENWMYGSARQSRNSWWLGNHDFAHLSQNTAFFGG